MSRRKKKKLETSKLLAVYLFFLLNVIIAYAMIAMWHFEDLGCLELLVSSIASEIVLYGIYCLKAYHGKKQEEKIKLDREKWKLEEAQADPLDNDEKEL